MIFSVVVYFVRLASHKTLLSTNVNCDSMWVHCEGEKKAQLRTSQFKYRKIPVKIGILTV